MIKRSSKSPRTIRLVTERELAAACGGRAWDGDYGFEGVGVVGSDIGDGTLSGGVGGLLAV